MFSDDKNSGGVDLNICALIAFVTIRERLKATGAIGFIMPDSILFNKSFEGFRKMQLPDGRKFYLNNVIRWNNPAEKPFDPVSIDFAEYYFSFNEIQPIPVYDRKAKAFKVAFTNPNSFNNHFTISNEADCTEIKKVLGHNDLVFRSGINLIKGGHYLLSFKEKISDKASRFYVFERQGDRIRVSDRTIDLETEIVYPFIKSENIGNNEIKQANFYCIFPYPYGSKEPYSLDKLRSDYPLFYEYFMSTEVQNSLSTQSKYNKRIQKPDFDVGIFRVGEYTYSDYFLATRDNTKPTFSIVGKIDTPWGEKKMPIFDGHINYLSRDESGQPLTLERIKQLYDIFTQRGVKLYIKASSDSRSMSARLYNDIALNKKRT